MLPGPATESGIRIAHGIFISRIMFAKLEKVGGPIQFKSQRMF